ncbi:MAG: peptidylprolyl isomerase [Polyangia bacterium]|nr:peptidylprolyl isomerase [Polyangia bacterium]
MGICAVWTSLALAASCGGDPSRSGECEGEARKPALPAPGGAEGLWLVEAGRPAHSQSVAGLLGHPQASVRERAALAAGRLATRRLLAAARERLSDESPSVRRAACEASALGEDHKAEEPLLFRLAMDPDLEVRRAALRALGLVGGALSARALHTLAKDGSAPGSLRLQALQSLAILGRRGVSGMKPALGLALQLLVPGKRADRGADAGKKALAGAGREANASPMPGAALAREAGMKPGAGKGAGRPADAGMGAPVGPVPGEGMRASPGPGPDAGARSGSRVAAAAASASVSAATEGPASAEDRLAAAQLLGALVDRFDWARAGISRPLGRELARECLRTKDAELADALGRVTVKLGLHGPLSLSILVRRGGLSGRVAAEALVGRDGQRGSALPNLVEELIRELPKTACKQPAPVMLWELLGHLAARPEGAWLPKVVESWVGAMSDLGKKEPSGSCARQTIARLECRAAALADRVLRALQRTPRCAGGVLGEDEQRAFVAEALGSGRFGPGAGAELERLFSKGGPRTRAAALEAAGRLGTPLAERLILKGLQSSDGPTFSAAAEACGALAAAPRPGAAAASATASAALAYPLATGPDSSRECVLWCRRALLALELPPRPEALMRWMDLVKRVQGIGDGALVARLKAAAAQHHPTLREHALAALGLALGRRPPEPAWDAADRPPPAEPLESDATLRLQSPEGEITVLLRRDWAPMSAAHLVELAQGGALSKTSYHRVVPGFVIQGGDPSGTGHGGDTGLLLSEWSSVPFRRGVVGLAHSGKDTEGSQLFIVLGPASHLDFRYTAVGEVTSGIEVAERILPGSPLRVTLVGPPPRRRRPMPVPDLAPMEQQGPMEQRPPMDRGEPRTTPPRPSDARPIEPLRLAPPPRGTAPPPRGTAPPPRGSAQPPRGSAQLRVASPPRRAGPPRPPPRQPAMEPAPGEGTIRLSPGQGGSP